MGKGTLILLAAALLGGTLLVQSGALSTRARGETINTHENEVLARQIALSAMNIGLDAVKTDSRSFFDGPNLSFNQVPFRNGTYDLIGAIVDTSSALSIHAIGYSGDSEYHVCTDMGNGGGGPIDSAMIIDAEDAVVDFRGNSFLIDGNDTNPPSMGGLPPFNGGPTPGPNLPVHAVGVPNASVETIVESEPTSGQEDNITGKDGDNDVYSGPTYFDIDAFYAEALTMVDTTFGAGNFNGNDVYGTPSDPSVVRITGDANITGNWTGYGVLLVEGNLTIGAGDFMWEGIVMVVSPDGADLEVNLTGGVEVYGAMILQTGEPLGPDDPSLNLDLAQLGNASVSYSAATIDRLAAEFYTIQQTSPHKIFVAGRRESKYGC